MAILCPHCAHSLSLKDAKPGKYQPKCPKCGQRFNLQIRSDPNNPPVVSKIADPATTNPSTAGASPAPSGANGAPAGATVAAAVAPSAAEMAATGEFQAPAAHASAVDATGVFAPSNHSASPDNGATGVYTPPAPPASQREVPTGVFSPPAQDVTLPQGADVTGAFVPPEENQGATGAWSDPAGGAASSSAQPAASAGTVVGSISTGPSKAGPASSGSSVSAGGSVSAGPSVSAGGVRAGNVTVGAAAGVTAAGRVHDATSAGGTGRPGADLGVPEVLGGYKIVKQLGKGGMGAVYLARQMSLDRNVALKVMLPQWSRDPIFVARFTREAYAAAQLVHHNVIQIYDIGAQKELNFFSMEFVKGQSLQDLLKDSEKLDVEVAVGYILQAARGLKFAHDQGLIHRDIKPDNLMLNDQGIVKVADLGLVKAAGAAEPAGAPSGENAGPDALAGAQSKLAAMSGNVTLANVAMGTPAYMAPEQAINAAGVDHRADIYSLGCTLYVLVTGKTPFVGKTAWEVITKHKTEPMVRPDLVVKRVPKELGDIIMKMTAKGLDERYADLSEVIRDLEKFLGVQSAGAFSPKEEHAQLLDEGVKAYNGAALAKMRLPARLALGGMIALTFLICLFIGWKYALGALTMGAAAAIGYFVVGGWLGRSQLFVRVREYLFGARWTDWLSWGMGGLVFLAVLAAADSLLHVLGFAALGALFGAVLYFGIDRPLTAQRAPALERVESLLKTMRLRGVEEDAVRQFVAKYSGDRWEELFEALFGFEAKLAARAFAPERGKPREKFGAWREPLLRSIEAREKARREEKERRHLQKIEEQNLKAKGVSADEAKNRAAAAAEAMVGQAAEIREQAQAAAANPRAAATVVDPVKRRAMLKSMIEAAEREKPPSTAHKLGRFAASPFALLLGGQTRFIAGLALLGLGALWVQQNFTADSLKNVGDSVKAAATSGQADAATAEAIAQQATGLFGPKKPLELPLFPGFIAGTFFNSFAPLVAGLILLLSAMGRGFKPMLFGWCAAGVAFCGQLILPNASGWMQLAPIGAGLAIAVAGVVLGRSRD